MEVVAGRGWGAGRGGARGPTHCGDVAAAAGVAVRVVMDILGHTQLSQTVATYQHTAPELAVDAAERISRALWAQAA